MSSLTEPILPTSVVAGSNSNAEKSNPFNSIDCVYVLLPFILITFITLLSFIFQNVKGGIYLGFVAFFIILREVIYYAKFGKESNQKKQICDSFVTPFDDTFFGKRGNLSFSSFVIVFTIVYRSMPMFMNQAPNFVFFSLLLFYFILDIFIKYKFSLKNECILSVPELIINIILGGPAGVVSVLFMDGIGSSKSLFFNEVQSSKEQCSQPTKQTFKCDVYKDGKLVQTI